MKKKLQKIEFSDLIASYWEEAPGIPIVRQAESEQYVLTVLGNPSKVDNAAVGLDMVTQCELLLATNLLLRDRAVEAWPLLDKCAAQGKFYYQVLAHCLWVPSRYESSVFGFQDFCTQFALALARGSDEDATWYAAQLFNLDRSGLAAASCPAKEFLAFYVEIAMAYLNNEWPCEHEISQDLGLYRNLFLTIHDQAANENAIIVCADYHQEVSCSEPENEDAAFHPFRLWNTGHLAYEIMAWIAIRRRLGNPITFYQSHLMLPTVLFNPKAQHSYADIVLQKLTANADIAFGEDWNKVAVPHFDEMS